MNICIYTYEYMCVYVCIWNIEMYMYTYIHKFTAQTCACKTPQPPSAKFARNCNTLQLTLLVCILNCFAEILLQHTSTHCNTLQHAATRYNTLQHAATHCSTVPLQRTLLVSSLNCLLQILLQHTVAYCNTP